MAVLLDFSSILQPHASARRINCPVADTGPALSSERPPHGRILFVDDDADVAKAASLLLGRHGMEVAVATDSLQARSQLAAGGIDVVLLDLNFTRGATSGEEGMALLRQLMAEDPQAVVVVVTAHSGVNVAVRAMQAGASDFVIKPWNNARLLATLEGALALHRRRRQATEREGGAAGEAAEPVLLGESAAMTALRAQVARAGATEAGVLVLGGPGLGKSLVARRLHLASARRAGPFVAVDCSALGAQDLELALWGGGDPASGALARAKGGSLVLEEVAEAPPALQLRLAAALEGAGVRTLATSRRTRAALQGRGGLRDELFYPLSTLEIELAPLAARGEDILTLLRHYLALHAARHGRPAPALGDAAAALALAAPWPGGVRALRQAAERAILLSDGEVLQPADLGLQANPVAGDEGPGRLQVSERALIAAALKRHSFNVSHAARDLGLTRPALYRRMAKHGL